MDCRSGAGRSGSIWLFKAAVAATAATAATAEKLRSVTGAAGVIFRSGMSLASEGGAAFAAHATTVVQEAADQVVLNAGLTPEQGQLIGILVGTSVGTVLLWCLRCWCRSAKRGRRRSGRQQHARLVDDEAGYDSYDDAAEYTQRREPWY